MPGIAECWDYLVLPPAEELGMKVSDWVMVAAIVLGPILAVQVAKFLEGQRERRRARLGIFHTLMRTRAARVSPHHVEALNAIDLYFRKDKRVAEAWKVYLDHLNAVNEKDVEAWARRGDDYFVDLLAGMASVLKYDFDKVELRRGIYAPRAHGEAELDSLVIRRSLAEILSGKRAVPVYLTPPAAPPAEADKPRTAGPQAKD